MTEVQAASRVGARRLMPSLGQDEEFELFFNDMLERAFRLAYRIVGGAEAAEDVAAEALARAYADWRRVRDLPYREAWVLRVAANLAIDSAKRQRFEPPSGREVDPAEVAVLRVALLSALRTLPRRQREAIALRYLAELPESEVAEVLGISVGSVKTHVHRATLALKCQLGEPLQEGILNDGP